jgi:hypothetical protein
LTSPVPPTALDGDTVTMMGAPPGVGLGMVQTPDEFVWQPTMLPLNAAHEEDASTSSVNCELGVARHSAMTVAGAASSASNQPQSSNPALNLFLTFIVFIFTPLQLIQRCFTATAVH